MATAEAVRLRASLGKFVSSTIDLDVGTLAHVIWVYLKDVAQINTVQAGDLRVYEATAGHPPTDVVQAITSGTPFFDAIYYFGLNAKAEVTCEAAQDFSGGRPAFIVQTQRALLLTYLFIMFRGGYPLSGGNARQTDIPTFLVQQLNMTETPRSVSEKLASFNINKVPIGWVKHINPRNFALSIQNRLAIGLPGYRMMAPFAHYDCKADATPEAKAAYAWVRTIATKPADWNIFPPTRDPILISRLGSINANLGNLMLECFTEEQLDQMVAPAVRMIFQKPARDPRATKWKSWVSLGELVLTDPIFPIVASGSAPP